MAVIRARGSHMETVWCYFRDRWRGRNNPGSIRKMGFYKLWSPSNPRSSRSAILGSTWSRMRLWRGRVGEKGRRPRMAGFHSCSDQEGSHFLGSGKAGLSVRDPGHSQPANTGWKELHFLPWAVRGTAALEGRGCASSMGQAYFFLPQI